VSSRYDALERLQRLRESGALTDEEFQAEKRRLLGHGVPDVPEAPAAPPATGEIEVVDAGEENHSRLPLYLLIAAGSLIAAVVAGLLLGRVVSGPGGENRSQAEIPQEKLPADLNVIEAAPPADLRSLPTGEQLDRAFQAAFGAKGTATLESRGSEDDVEVMRYTPGRLVWASYGPILLSEGKGVDAPHVAPGRIAIHYLKPAGDEFQVVRAYLNGVETGSSGQVARWSVSPRFSDWPVIAAEGGGTWQGYTCSTLTLTELRPTGPVDMVTVPLSYDDTGAQPGNSAGTAIGGKILNVVKNESFDVVYTGARSFSEHWVRNGDRYQVAGGGPSQMKTC
jgi:hypothetical protein